MKKGNQKLKIERKITPIRKINEYKNKVNNKNERQLRLKIFNNGEIAIVYRTLDELDAYGKIVSRFEENFENEIRNLRKFSSNTDVLLFN